MAHVYELIITLLMLVLSGVFIWLLVRAINRYKTGCDATEAFTILSYKAIGARERLFAFKYRQSEYLMYVNPNCACVIDKLQGELLQDKVNIKE